MPDWSQRGGLGYPYPARPKAGGEDVSAGRTSVERLHEETTARLEGSRIRKLESLYLSATVRHKRRLEKALEDLKKYYDQLIRENDRAEAELVKKGMLDVEKQVKALKSEGIDKVVSGLGEAVGLAREFGAHLGLGVAGAGAGWWFVDELKKALDTLRELRGMAMGLAPMLGGAAGTGARYGVAGLAMGQIYGTELTTGMSREQQLGMAAFYGRTGLATTPEEVWGAGGRPGLMQEMWTAGGILGMAPEQAGHLAAQLQLLGVSPENIPEELLGLGNAAREARMGIDEYMEKVLELTKETSKYGGTVERSSRLVTVFSKELQEGTVTLGQLADLTQGLMGPAQMGPRAFVGTALMGGEIDLTGLGPGTRRAVEGLKGRLEELGSTNAFVLAAEMQRLGEENEDYAAAMMAALSQMLWQHAGEVVGPGGTEPARLAAYSEMMRAAGIETPERLTELERIRDALGQLKDPAELMRDASVGLTDASASLTRSGATMEELYREQLGIHESTKSFIEQMNEVMQVTFMQFAISVNDLLASIGKGPPGWEEEGGMREQYIKGVANVYAQAGVRGPAVEVMGEYARREIERYVAEEGRLIVEGGVARAVGAEPFERQTFAETMLQPVTPADILRMQIYTRPLEYFQQPSEEEVQEMRGEYGIPARGRAKGGFPGGMLSAEEMFPIRKEYTLNLNPTYNTMGLDPATKAQIKGDVVGEVGKNVDSIFLDLKRKETGGFD